MHSPSYDHKWGIDYFFRLELNEERTRINIIVPNSRRSLAYLLESLKQKVTYNPHQWTMM